MNKKTEPYILHFPAIGQSDIGFISIAENQKHVPFDIKRTFWTYFTPQSITRGFHAHHDTEMVLVALTGKIIVYTEMPNGEKQNFILEQATEGLYLPRLCWHTMQYSHTAIQLVLASTEYNSADYVRDYNDFLNLKS